MTPQLYSIYKSEREIMAELIKVIRSSLLVRSDITPHQISGIAKLLFGLERMPRVTPNIRVEIFLKYKAIGSMESNNVGLKLDYDSLRLDQGGYVESTMGGDSYSAIVFEVGAGWRGDCHNVADVLEWVESLREKSADLECELSVSSEDDEIDWYHEDDEEDDCYWGQLENSKEKK